MADQNLRNSTLSFLHPIVREKTQQLLGQLNAQNIPFKAFEAFRSPQRQAWLYAQGRTRSGSIVTKAEPWESYHQYGMAVDFVLFENGQWSWDDSGVRKSWWGELHKVGRAIGLEPLSWELPHLQLANWSLKRLHAGDYPAGGDESWADNLESVIVGWTGAPPAPPVPGDSVVRPALTA